MTGSAFADLLAMGGYALYVWGSLIMCLAAVVWEVITLLQRHARALEDLRDDARSAGAKKQRPQRPEGA
jgi:heme exporter protein D